MSLSVVLVGVTKLKQEEKNLNYPAVRNRFNGAAVVIQSGLISGLQKASSDLRGQVVIIVASVIALH